MKCEKCGNDLQEGQKFCSVCGQKVEVIHACPKCGTKLGQGQRFCVVCGQPLYREEAGEGNNPKMADQKILEPRSGNKQKKRSGFGKGLLIAGGVMAGLIAIAGIFGGNQVSTSGNKEDPSMEVTSTEIKTTDAQASAFIEAYGFNPAKAVDRDSFIQSSVAPAFKDIRDNLSNYKGKGIKVKGLIIGKSDPQEYIEGVTELAYDANEWSKLLDTYYAYSCMNDDMDNPGGYIVISEDASAYTNEWKLIYGYPVGVNSKGDVIIWGELFTDEGAVIGGTETMVSSGGNSGDDFMTSEIKNTESFDESPSGSTDMKYDFGYNTNPDDIRYNSDYFTANVQVIKDNGFIGGKVNITGLFTYAGTGHSVGTMSWYDNDTMENLDAYFISDAYGEGQYVVLSAYNSNAYADDYVTVYGTVIDIDKNGVVYIAGQLIEPAPAG